MPSQIPSSAPGSSAPLPALRFADAPCAVIVDNKKITGNMHNKYVFVLLKPFTGKDFVKHPLKPATAKRFRAS